MSIRALFLWPACARRPIGTATVTAATARIAAAEHGSFNCIRQVAPSRNMIPWGHMSLPLLVCRHIDRFSRFRKAHPFTQTPKSHASKIQWAGCLLKSVPLRRDGIWPPANKRFPGPERVHTPKRLTVGSAVFAQFTVLTNTETDTCSNSPHLARTACSAGDAA